MPITHVLTYMGSYGQSLQDTTCPYDYVMNGSSTRSVTEAGAEHERSSWASVVAGRFQSLCVSLQDTTCPYDYVIRSFAPASVHYVNGINNYAIIVYGIHDVVMKATSDYGAELLLPFRSCPFKATCYA